MPFNLSLARLFLRARKWIFEHAALRIIQNCSIKRQAQGGAVPTAWQIINSFHPPCLGPNYAISKYKHGPPPNPN